MQVKVWNDNVHPYKEQFREMNISIPAKSFIWMEDGLAQIFKGTFAPIKVDGDGNPIAEGFKMIRIEKPDLDAEDAADETTDLFICNFDGKKFNSQKELDAYVDQNYADEIFVDPEAEKEIRARNKVGRPKKLA